MTRSGGFDFVTSAMHTQNAFVPSTRRQCQHLKQFSLRANLKSNP